MKNKNREKNLSEGQTNPYADFNIRHVTLTSCDPSDIRRKLAKKVKEEK